MNYGQFKKDKYIKNVIFSKAVLWKDRQLSLPKEIMDRIRRNPDIKTIEFVDLGKNERWVFNPKKVFANMQLKQVGQEPQYYFSIDILTKKIKSEPITEQLTTFNAMSQMVGTKTWEDIGKMLHSK